MTEEWRPVVGYEDLYAVSDAGRVVRLAGGRGARSGRVLRRHERSPGDGYRFVQLSRHDHKRTFGVHVLVAEAFLGRRPRGKFPNHKNLDKQDNRASNLEWMTNRQNTMHAIRAGRKPGRPMPGQSNGRSVLTREQVGEVIRQKGHIGQRVLAKLCGVSKTAIQKIHQGKGWTSEWPEDLRVREWPR